MVQTYVVQDSELFVNKLDPKKISINFFFTNKTFFLLLFHYFLFVFLLNLNYYMLLHDHYYEQVLNENIVSQDEYLLYTKHKRKSLKIILIKIKFLLMPFHQYYTKFPHVLHLLLHILMLLKNKQQSYHIVEHENNIKLYL
jgi:hypothetical protein